MSLTRKSKGVIGAAIIGALPYAFAWSESKDVHYEIGVGLPYFSFDSNYELEDELGLRGLLGLRTGNLQFEVVYDDLGTELTSLPITDMDVQQTYVNLLLFGDTGNNFDPFISAGWGETEFAYEEFTDKTTVTNLGAGFKYYFNDHFAVRPSVNYFIPTEFDSSYASFAVTFSYLTGRGSGKVKSKPVATPVNNDLDNDGINNTDDQCPNTPAGILVNGYGCPMDSDGDGIFDYEDDCANTPSGQTVDKKGCPEVEETIVEIELKVYFESESAEVKPQFYPEIQKIAEFMAQHSGTNVVIEGHSDTLGDADYNKELSQKRAKAVEKVLVDVMKVDASRVSSVGYGEERPIADESTGEGLLANRRVVAKISATVRTQQ